MANISEATGYFQLIGDWTREQATNFAYMLYTVEHAATDYTTNTHLSFDKLVDELSFTRQQGQHITRTKIPFEGFGRWAFSSNLENFQHWTDINKERWKSEILPSITPSFKITFEEYDQRRLQMIRDFAKHKLKVFWQYVDMEPGVNYLGKIEGYMSCSFEYSTVDHTNEYILKFIIKNSEDYECTLRNQCILIENDTQRLFQIAEGLRKVYKLDKDISIITKIFNTIYEHPTWYDLPAYANIETLEDVPDALHKAIFKMVKGDK